MTFTDYTNIGLWIFNALMLSRLIRLLAGGEFIPPEPQNTPISCPPVVRLAMIFLVLYFVWPFALAVWLGVFKRDRA